jgi:hypothetical protein
MGRQVCTRGPFGPSAHPPRTVGVERPRTWNAAHHGTSDHRRSRPVGTRPCGRGPGRARGAAAQAAPAGGVCGTAGEPGPGGAALPPGRSPTGGVPRGRRTHWLAPVVDGPGREPRRRARPRAAGGERARNWSSSACAARVSTQALLGSAAAALATGCAGPLVPVPGTLAGPDAPGHIDAVTVGVDARDPAGGVRPASPSRQPGRTAYTWALPVGAAESPFPVPEKDRAAWEDHEVALLSDAPRPWRAKYADVDVRADVLLFPPPRPWPTPRRPPGWWWSADTPPPPPPPWPSRSTRDARSRSCRLGRGKADRPRPMGRSAPVASNDAGAR